MGLFGMTRTEIQDFLNYYVALHSCYDKYMSKAKPHDSEAHRAHFLNCANWGRDLTDEGKNNIPPPKVERKKSLIASKLETSLENIVKSIEPRK